MKTLYTILIILLAFEHIHAQSTPIDSALNRAQTYYAAQQYDSVVTIYKSIIDQGFRSDKLYFNLANAYYKQRDIPQAIVWYERALVLNPYNEDIHKNLAIANTQQSDKVEYIPQSMLQLWYPYVYRLWHANTWATIAIILFVLSLLSIVWFLFTQERRNKKLSFFVALFCIALTALSYSNAYHREQELTHNEYAIVLEPSLRILTEPNETAKELVVVHGGLRVRIEKQNGDWTSIRLPDGKVGWVQHFAIERI